MEKFRNALLVLATIFLIALFAPKTKSQEFFNKAPIIPQSQLVVYGNLHPQQVAYVWVPEKPISTPVPLVAYFTSGGWMGEVVIPRTPGAFQKYLDAGFAVAYAKYAYTGMENPPTSNDPPGTYPFPEDDVRQLIKFFRSGGMPKIGTEFIAAEGRSAGAQGVLYASFLPNDEDGITRPNISLVGAVPGHYYPSLIQNIPSAVAKHLGGNTNLLTSVPYQKQIESSPRYWIANYISENRGIAMHITVPNSNLDYPFDSVPINALSHDHNVWNSFALHYDLKLVSPKHVKKGVLLNLEEEGISAVEGFKHKTRWITARFNEFQKGE